MTPPSPRKRGASRPRKTKRSGPAPEPLQPIENPPEIDSFLDWPGLGDEVQAAIAEMGITVPTPIQALSIGPVLEGRDMIAKAETGTGKTLAFGAPMVAKVDPARRTVLGLVLSPTRELAEQVFKVLAELGAKRGLIANLIVGGEPMQPQVKALQSGSQLVVGTPGRVLDLMNQGFLSFPWTEFVVLDEADKMLEIGFIDDVKKILEASNEYRQTLLFSATFPPALLHMARDYTNNPLEVATASGVSTADTVDQHYFEVTSTERDRDLRALLRASGEKDVFLVFCDRRTEVDRLMRQLERERFSVKALHGGYDQPSRFRVMDAFRTGDVKVLVATDVASRGLDVNHVTHVVNLNAPRDVSDYTHRIGRTGRAGRTGTAITFVGGIDRKRWQDVQRALPKKVPLLQSVHDLFDDGRPRREKPRSRDRDDRPRGRDRDGKSRGRDRDEKPRGRDRDENRSRGRAKPDRDDSDRPRSGNRDREGEDRPRKRRERSDGERQPREPRKPREERQPREAREPRQPREKREPREARKPREDRQPRDERPASRDRKERSRPKDRDADRPRKRDKPLQEGGSGAKRSPRKDAPADRPRKNDSGGGFGAGL